MNKRYFKIDIKLLFNIDLCFLLKKIDYTLDMTMKSQMKN